MFLLFMKMKLMKGGRCSAICDVVGVGDEGGGDGALVLGTGRDTPCPSAPSRFVRLASL